ncbi:MAG: carboxypeptidase M32 [Gaiella sp.]
MKPAALERLRERLGQIADLQMTERLLDWDQQVMMPPGGIDARARQIEVLHRLSHEMFISEETGDLLAEVAPLADSLPADDLDGCLVRVTQRDYDKAVRVPPALAAELARVGSEAQQAWAEARENDDYAAFSPWLERTLELKLRYAACFDGADDPYDHYLDDFEQGMKTEEVRTIFARLKPALIDLVQQYATDEPDEPFVHGPFPAEPQHELSLALMRAFGADDLSFRLDPTVHPFCSSLSPTDVRLTTRYDVDDLHASSLFSTMHEVGHGLYERGVDPVLERTPMGSGCSSILHESQSRLWENVIGRSLPFWRWFYPQTQDAFPRALSGVSLERFHRAINRPRRSLIRVDADEMTYGLHIIIRFELEQDLLGGRLHPRDLPAAWNAAFEETLHVPVPNDRVGCLQDVHWSAGLFGYFPTYQLGNVLSAQIWDVAGSEISDATEQIARGDFGEIHAWLRDRVYRLGRRFSPSETIEHVVGGPLDPEPYLAYLEAKAGSLAPA